MSVPAADKGKDAAARGGVLGGNRSMIVVVWGLVVCVGGVVEVWVACFCCILMYSDDRQSSCCRPPLLSLACFEVVFFPTHLLYNPCKTLSYSVSEPKAARKSQVCLN